MTRSPRQAPLRFVRHFGTSGSRVAGRHAWNGEIFFHVNDLKDTGFVRKSPGSFAKARVRSSKHRIRATICRVPSSGGRVPSSFDVAEDATSGPGGCIFCNDPRGECCISCNIGRLHVASHATTRAARCTGCDRNRRAGMAPSPSGPGGARRKWLRQPQHRSRRKLWRWVSASGSTSPRRPSRARGSNGGGRTPGATSGRRPRQPGEEGHRPPAVATSGDVPRHRRAIARGRLAAARGPVKPAFVFGRRRRGRAGSEGLRAPGAVKSPDPF